MPKPEKSNFYAYYKSYRIPLSNTMSGMTNITTTVVLVVFLYLGLRYLIQMLTVVFEGPQLLLMMISWLRNGRSDD